MRKIGRVDQFGFRNINPSEENKLFVLHNNAYVREKSILCNKEDIEIGSLVSYELNIRKDGFNIDTEAINVQLLSKEDNLDFLFLEFDNNDRDVAICVRNRIAACFGMNAFSEIWQPTKEEYPRKDKPNLLRENYREPNHNRKKNVQKTTVIKKHSINKKPLVVSVINRGRQKNSGELNEFVEAVFENRVFCNEVIKYFDKVYLEEEEFLSQISKEDFTEYEPKAYFIMQLLYIKKALYFFRENSNREIIVLARGKLSLYKNNNAIVECFCDLLDMFIHKSDEQSMRNKMIQKIHHFIYNKYDYLLTHKDILFNYFALMLPSCKKGEMLFREAQYIKSNDGNDEKTLYYCRGKYCYLAETVSRKNINAEYSKYTLLEGIYILGLDMKFNRVKEDKTYIIAIISGWINHFLDDHTYTHMFCSYCGKPLIPHFEENLNKYGKNWVYLTSYLKCCDNNYKHDEKVYISYCKKPGCNKIIDSRLSETICSRKIYICNACGWCNCMGVHIKVEYDNGRPIPIENIRNSDEEEKNPEFIQGYRLRRLT